MAKTELYAQVDVSLGYHQYPIIITRHGLSDGELLLRFIQSKQVCIVTNETIAPLYLKKLQSLLSGMQCDVVILPDGEGYKNEASLFTIYDSLLKNKHHRDTCVIALGGGVIGDLTGFAAATYQRGVSYIQIPTTLLAQIDSSVGGKTGINHPLGKNMIGSFYQPELVLIDINTLESLPEREFKAGLAEMIKYGLLAGGDFLKSLQNSLKKGLTPKSPELPRLIQQCCQIKATIVESDERESGQRALLNLGHTFAHALEAYTHYERWLHGEAVAIGLYCCALLSVQCNVMDIQWVNLIEGMLIDAGLPHKIPESINMEQLKDLMRLDKKIKNNCLRFVVIKKPGQCYLTEEVTEECLNAALMGASKGD